MHREDDKRVGLLSYIKGDKRGRAAHELEREAMQDPFLSDALDGYEDLDSSEAADGLNRLTERIEQRCATQNAISRGKPSRRRYIYWLSAAAAVLLICTLSFELGRMSGSKSARSNEAYLSEESYADYYESDAACESFYGDWPEEEYEMRESHVAQLPPKSAEQRSEPVPDSELLSKSARRPAPKSARRPEPQSARRPEPKSAPAPAPEPACAPEPEPEFAPDSEFDIMPAPACAPFPLSDEQPESDIGVPVCAEKSAPQPRSGYADYYKYIHDTLAEMPDLDSDAITGVVVLSFRIDDAGRPTDFEIVESPSQNIARAVIEIIRNGELWDKSGMVESFSVDY